MSIKTNQLTITRSHKKQHGASITISPPNLDIKAGEVCILKGASGSGKTSFLYALAGLITTSSGEIKILNQSLSSLKEAQRDTFRGENIGMIFQDHQLFDDLNVLENLLMGIRFAKGRAANTKEHAQAEKLLHQTGLKAYLKHRPKELSLGQQQRVAIARAMLTSPKIILADEPTASLDPANKKIVMELITSMSAELNATLMISTHDEMSSFINSYSEVTL